MAIETIRRSGYRMVGGIYLVGQSIFPITPERLPVCSECGQGPGVSRNITQIKVGPHMGSYLALVGKHFYPTTASFIEEAAILGVSKRVPFVAKDIVLGLTTLWLAHPLAYREDWGIFAYFIPSRIEKLVWEGTKLPDEPNTTFIQIPRGDMDHSPYRTKKLLKIDGI
jgi:hypothetical protein